MVGQRRWWRWQNTMMWPGPSEVGSQGRWITGLIEKPRTCFVIKIHARKKENSKKVLKDHSGHWPFTCHRSRIIENHITIENSLYRFWADSLRLTYIHLWLRGRGQRGTGGLHQKYYQYHPTTQQSWTSYCTTRMILDYNLKGSDDLGRHLTMLACLSSPSLLAEFLAGLFQAQVVFHC